MVIFTILTIWISQVFSMTLKNATLGLTPQMGWNSWNYFACNINETVIKGAADAMVSTGLKALGYEYINIDDCWSANSRSSDGKLLPDPVSFPNGISKLADYIHSKGLKLGIYSDAGNFTCEHRPGSLGFESTDASTFAGWGVDYLKYDNCYNDDVPPVERYSAMGNALKATGGSIFYSICNWGQNYTAEWAPALGNSWRTTLDIKDYWNSMKLNLLINDQHPEVAKPGSWNDPDMLEVGNGGMTYDEYVSHFTLWALVKAPLIIGCDMAAMDPGTFKILSNSEIIAINQDPLGVQGTCYSHCDSLNRLTMASPEVWAGPLSNGDMAVVIINWGESNKGYTLRADIDLKSSKTQMTIRDLWAHKDLGTFDRFFTIDFIAPHAVRAFRITLS